MLLPPVDSSQYTSWVFGHRLRTAGLLGSMGRVASSVDNSMIEPFWSTLQRELLDTRSWDDPAQLGSAIFEWIEAWYNRRRRHTSLGMPTPAAYEHQWRTQQANEHLHTAARRLSRVSWNLSGGPPPDTARG